MASAAEVAQSLAEIRRYHELGCHVPDTKYGTTTRAAERLKLNIDYMRACRRFREQYTPAQLEQLCKACQAGGYAIGWARVRLLLSVPSATKRKSLLRQAIEEQWSKSQLQVAIRHTYGRRARKGAGRPTKLDAEGSLDSAYDKGLELCMKFESFMAAVRREGKDGKPLVARMPPTTRKCMERAEDAMNALATPLRPQVMPRLTSKPKKSISAKR